MKINNDDFSFGEEVVEKKPVEKKENNDFVNVDFGDLLIYHAINKVFSLKELLNEMGIEVKSTNMYCPFHHDELTGKPSAKYFSDTDSLHCFSEQKTYSAYHALKILYGANMKEKFKKAWNQLGEADRERLLIEYGDGDGKRDADKDYISPVWRQLAGLVLVKFRDNEVTYKQYKTALYKVFTKVEESFVK